MRERPILFSDAMVRAILAGTKTQTRRVIAGARGAFWDHRSYTGTVERDGVVRFREGSEGTNVHGSPEVRCPYGAVGDQLWVREAWRACVEEPEIDLRADQRSLRRPMHGDDEWWARWRARSAGGRWQPSIYMPRWASRLTLDVTSVRVQRLLSISEEDARAEGVEPHEYAYCAEDARYRMSFARLWDSINGERAGCAWKANPWVWVVGFEVRRG